MVKKETLITEESQKERLKRYRNWMSRDLTEIDDTLTRILPDDITEFSVSNNPKIRARLLSALVENEQFKFLRTYHNEEYANVVLDELVGVSFIKDILDEYPTTSDIGYNGRAMYLDTAEGKIPYARSGEKSIEEERAYFPQLTDEEFNNLPVISHSSVEKLISRFATRENTTFTKSKPLFNGFSDSIRISSTYSSLAYEGVTMSLRITRPSLALNDKNFGAFAPKSVSRLLDLAINAHTSVVLSGETGSGKTETAKYMLNFIDKVRGEPRDKIIVIEDIFEMQATTLYPEKDILEWQTTGDISISDHVKNALRNFPRWVIVSETRGAEAKGLLESVLSGSPVITTLHAVNNDAVPSRFTGMVAMAPGEIDLDATKQDFLTYFGLGIHISRKLFTNGRVQRYADEIVKFDPKAPNGKYWPILQQGFEEYDNKIHRWWIKYPLPEDLKEKLRIENNIAPGAIDQEWVPTYDFEKEEEDVPVILVRRDPVDGHKIREYKKDKDGKKVMRRRPKKDQNGHVIYKRDEQGHRIPALDKNNERQFVRHEEIFDFKDYE